MDGNLSKTEYQIVDHTAPSAPDPAAMQGWTLDHMALVPANTATPHVYISDVVVTGANSDAFHAFPNTSPTADGNWTVAYRPNFVGTISVEVKIRTGQGNVGDILTSPVTTIEFPAMGAQAAQNVTVPTAQQGYVYEASRTYTFTLNSQFAGSFLINPRTSPDAVEQYIYFEQDNTAPSLSVNSVYLDTTQLAGEGDGKIVTGSEANGHNLKFNLTLSGDVAEGKCPAAFVAAVGANERNPQPPDPLTAPDAPDPAADQPSGADPRRLE